MSTNSEQIQKALRLIFGISARIESENDKISHFELHDAVITEFANYTSDFELLTRSMADLDISDRDVDSTLLMEKAKGAFPVGFFITNISPHEWYILPVEICLVHELDVNNIDLPKRPPKKIDKASGFQILVPTNEGICVVKDTGTGLSMEVEERIKVIVSAYGLDMLAVGTQFTEWGRLRTKMMNEIKAFTFTGTGKLTPLPGSDDDDSDSDSIDSVDEGGEIRKKTSETKGGDSDQVVTDTEIAKQTGNVDTPSHIPKAKSGIKDVFDLPEGRGLRPYTEKLLAFLLESYGKSSTIIPDVKPKKIEHPNISIVSIPIPGSAITVDAKVGLTSVSNTFSYVIKPQDCNTVFGSSVVSFKDKYINTVLENIFSYTSGGLSSNLIATVNGVSALVKKGGVKVVYKPITITVADGDLYPPEQLSPVVSDLTIDQGVAIASILSTMASYLGTDVQGYAENGISSTYTLHKLFCSATSDNYPDEYDLQLQDGGDVIDAIPLVSSGLLAQSIIQAATIVYSQKPNRAFRVKVCSWVDAILFKYLANLKSVYAFNSSGVTNLQFGCSTIYDDQTHINLAALGALRAFYYSS